MDSIKVAFLPEWLRNPYQVELRRCLSALGVSFCSLGAAAGPILFRLLRERPQVLHLHWLQPFYETTSGRLRPAVKLAFSLFGFWCLQRLGVRLVWTAHNLKNHEDRNPRLDRIIHRFIVRRADAIIAHCETAKQQITREFGLKDGGKITVIPHGHYMDAYENDVDRPAAREALDLPASAVVVLFFGTVRPYKGVLELVEAFRRIEADDARLVIAGKPFSADAVDLVTRRIGDDARIMFRPGFVPDEMVQVYLNACDVVALPYRDALTSGAAVLAMSFGRACIAPRLGCIKDILSVDGAFLYDPEADGGLVTALRQALDRREALRRMGEHNRTVAQRWGWPGIARETLAIYYRVCGRA